MNAPTVDKMTLTVLDDGTARLELDGISGANHAKAEELVKEFARLMGGELTIEKRKEGHAHSHATTHTARKVNQ